MAGTSQFGLIVAVIGLAGTAAVLSNRLSARLRVPAPAFFLVAAVIVGVASVLASSGKGHALTHGFSVFGYHVTGSTGTLLATQRVSRWGCAG